MKKILVFAAVMAALSSCSKNEVALNTSDTNAITFNTYAGVSTKGAILDQTALEADGFGVLAYDQGSEGEFSDGPIPNFMYNTMVSKGESNWSYSPIKYWSNDGYNTYSFFGYAPYTATPTTGDIVLSGNNVGGAPTATVTIADDAEDMIDFVAGQVVDITKYGTTTTAAENAADVTMYFKHQLTRVSFSAKADTNDDAGVASTYVNITSIRILGSAPIIPIDITTNGVEDVEGGVTAYNPAYASNALYKAGTYTFATTTTDADETVHGQDGTWVAGAQIEDTYDTESILAVVTPNDTDEAFENTDYATPGVLVQCSATAQTTGTDLFAEDEYLFLIPPVTTNADSDYITGIVSNDDDYDTKIMVEIIYDIVTLDEGLAAGYAPCSTNNLAIAAIPTDALVQGFAYNFLLTIKGSSIVDPTLDPEDPTTPPDESAFDAVVITGTLLEWDDTKLNDYPLTL